MYKLILVLKFDVDKAEVQHILLFFFALVHFACSVSINIRPLEGGGGVGGDGWLQLNCLTIL